MQASRANQNVAAQSCFLRPWSAQDTVRSVSNSRQYKVQLACTECILQWRNYKIREIYHGGFDTCSQRGICLMLFLPLILRCATFLCTDQRGEQIIDRRR